MKKAQKYVVRKVSEQGESAEVDGERFDALLDKMLDASPQTNVDVVARRAKKGKVRD